MKNNKQLETWTSWVFEYAKASISEEIKTLSINTLQIFSSLATHELLLRVAPEEEENERVRLHKRISGNVCARLVREYRPERKR